MANLIQIKRGAAAGLPDLGVGELALTTDTYRVYVGTAAGNKKVGAADFLDKAGDTMTGALVLNGAPTLDLHAATKGYVDALFTGLDPKASVRVATTQALPSHTFDTGVMTASANGALSNTYTDAVTLVATNRILVKDEGSGTSLENGIYVVTSMGDAGNPWVLTRATDADASAEVTSGMFCGVSEGTVNAGKQYFLSTADPITLNTTELTFSQLSGAGAVTAGNGMTQSGNTLNVVGTANRISVSADAVDIDANYAGQNTITTLGTIATGSWHATAIDADHGGTGQTSYAVGDILYASTTTALSKLADVAAGSFLRSGGVGVAPAWSTLVLPNAATAGDLPYASSANTVSMLGKGTARQQLAMNSGATAPEWVASIQSLMTEQGDILYASAANTPAALAHGTDAQFLKSGGHGANPAWTSLTLTHITNADTANKVIKTNGTNLVAGTLIDNSGALSAITTLSMSGQLTNTLADGTAPFAITSTTKVSNLNVDRVDGVHINTLQDGKLLKYTASGTIIEDSTIVATDVADAVSKKHSQNTDTGTTSATFQLLSGSSGIKLKATSLILELRNAADNAYIDLHAKNIQADGGGLYAGATGAQAGTVYVFGTSGTKVASITFGGTTSNRSYNLPDDVSTTLLGNVSTIDGGTW